MSTCECAHVLGYTQTIIAETEHVPEGMYQNLPQFLANEGIHIGLFDLVDGMRSEQACEEEIEGLRRELPNFAWFYYVYILL